MISTLFLRKQLKKGFSLVELLVVITIIAILSVAAYTAFGGQTIKARDSKRKQDIDTIQSALELYYINESAYPEELASGPAEDGLIPKEYLSFVPSDPAKAKKPYLYVRQGVKYELAATLENDGDPSSYEAYVVGNSDEPLIQAGEEALEAVEWAEDALADCAEGTDVVNEGSCVPYDPIN